MTRYTVTNKFRVNRFAMPPIDYMILEVDSDNRPGTKGFAFDVRRAEIMGGYEPNTFRFWVNWRNNGNHSPFKRVFADCEY